MNTSYAALCIALLCGTPGMSAQSLADRVTAARGTVAFSFVADSNVCGNGVSIRISEDVSPGWNTRSQYRGMSIGHRVGGGEDRRCDIAPARVVLTRTGAAVTGVRVTVGGELDRTDSELGVVSSREAQKFLLSIAPGLTGHAADDALMGAAIADGPVDWRRMLEIARDNGASESARKQSLFWASQEASQVATAGMSEVAADDDADTAVRKDALFYLSQRKNGDGVPSLIRVAKESRSVKLRKDAIWYLSQSKDARAIALFEQILSGR